MISYEPLNKRLKAAGLTKTALTAELGLSSRTVATISKGDKLATETLDKSAARRG